MEFIFVEAPLCLKTPSFKTVAPKEHGRGALCGDP